MLRGERKASSRVQSLDLRTAVCDNITVSVDEGWSVGVLSTESFVNLDVCHSIQVSDIIF